MSVIQTSAPGTCAKHGQFESGLYTYFERSDGSRFMESGPVCPACEKEQKEHTAKQQAERADKHRREALQVRRNAAKLEPRFEHCSFDNYTPQNAEQGKIVAWLRSWTDDLTNPEKIEAARRSSVGPCGVGKTHLAHAVANRLIDHTSTDDSKFRALYRNTPALLRAIKATWSKNTPLLDGEEAGLSETELLDRLCSANMLILDEVGIGFGSDFERNYLTEIIDRRYSGILPTILLSNLDVRGLETCLGVRAMDRLQEAPSRIFLLTGQSYRRKPATKQLREERL